MAYMDQEKKAKIAAELRKVIPRDWKYTLSVHHHSSLTLHIMAAPVDLFTEHAHHDKWSNGYIQLNEYYLETQYSGKLLETMQAIRKALNCLNYDRSDVQTDYFDVGYWAYIRIGRWNKPFQVLGRKPEPTYDELKARIAALETKTA
jgi:hypothetical protein